MTKLSKSQNRFQLQKISYLERMESVGEQPEPAYLEMFDLQELTKRNEEADLEWQKNNLEYDLRTTDWILAKARSNETYSQNLYAALCNNEFQKHDAWLILKDKTWSCSWRYAGGIAAGLHNGTTYDGADDYMEFYLMKDFDGSNYSQWVSEGTVTDEIRDDFKRIGWYLVENGMV